MSSVLHAQCGQADICFPPLCVFCIAILVSIPCAVHVFYAMVV